MRSEFLLKHLAIRYQSITAYYDWQDEAQEYKFQATGTDFNGNKSETPTLTVKHGG